MIRKEEKLKKNGRVRESEASLESLNLWNVWKVPHWGQIREGGSTSRNTAEYVRLGKHVKELRCKVRKKIVQDGKENIKKKQKRVHGKEYNSRLPLF